MIFHLFKEKPVTGVFSSNFKMKVLSTIFFLKVMAFRIDANLKGVSTKSLNLGHYTILKPRF